MRIALFFLINLIAAGAVAWLSIAQDQTFWTVVLRVIAVLVALQTLYVLWLLALAYGPKRQKDTKEAAPKEPVGRPAKDT